MKFSTKLKRISVALLAALLFFAVLPLGNAAAFAAEASAETLRVGFFAFQGYHNQEANGKRSGYGYEFLQLLARHTDFNYTYEYYDKAYAECLDLLEQGELDLVTSVSDSVERREKFLFSKSNIGTKSTILTVKAGNTDINEDDLATLNGKKIGMLKVNSSNELFKQFAEENDVTCTWMDVYETEADLTAALQRGDEVDAIVTSNLRTLQNEWLVLTVPDSAQPFYACTRKDEAGTALMEKINKAIDEMDLQDPDWRNVLHDKYYSTDTAGNIILSQDERAYLEELSAGGTKLKVLMNPDRKPYSYFENGEACGIFPALFEKMTGGLSLPYEYIPVEGRADYYEKRVSGAADIVIDFGDDLYLAEDGGYKITDPYYTTTHTMIKRRNLKGKPTKFATQKYVDNPYSDYLVKYVGAGTNYLLCESLDESIEAVRSGECDATIALSYVAELYMWADERNDLISELIGEATSSYTLGVNNTANHFLLSVLEKCVKGLDPSAASAVVTEEVTKFRPVADNGILYFLRRNPVYIALIVAAGLLLLFFVAMLVVRTVNQRKLEKKVSEATAKLKAQTAELSDALVAADAANRSKTTFLNNMSHDIRTPMNAIIGFTALAESHVDNKERTLDYLEKISQASNHLLSLINDVLDMSRIESGKIHIEDRPENLADILQGLRNIIQSDIHAKHLDLFIDTVDVTHEEVYCDKLRLNQVLLNLTSNAIKFTPSGGAVSVRITQKPSDKEGCGRYEFRVSDTGIGMSPEFVKVVFEPFTRERNTTVSGIQGTGLGMAITKNIVDIMGGTIGVTSEQGKGTEFTVSLDLRFAEDEPVRIPLTELKDRYSLVVDDDVVSCQSVAKMLRNIGMRAEWTVTGKEAIVRTAEAIEMGHPFEVYIIDWSMPDMDGITTVRKIRSLIGDDSPIILMSAYDWSDIEQEARGAGVTGFLSKPLFASDLHRALERSLGKTEPEPLPAPKQRVFEGKRLLLAEDNELNREIAEEILSEAGFSVESAENGQRACEMLEKAGPGYFDAVLMDVQMPIMNGYEATKRIRALEDRELAGIPIIAMTANAFEEDKANAFAAGMNEHLAKPIDPDAVLALLKKLLGGEDGETPAVAPER